MFHPGPKRKRKQKINFQVKLLSRFFLNVGTKLKEKAMFTSDEESF